MKYTTLITDFDNTLYDWFHMWHLSFSGMLNEISRISGISEDQIIPEVRKIHQQHGTSEYSHLIEDLPVLKKKFPDQDLSKIFENAIHAYRRTRKISLNLYPGVSETLSRLRAKGVLIVLYTDSLAFYTNFRVRRLNLDGLVDFVFSPPDHDLPIGTKSFTERDDARLHSTKHHYLPKGVRKPDKAALLDIVSDIGRAPSECIYVGDSLKNDISMAQDAGIADVWAKYGGVQHLSEYGLLQKVSHWTEADVEREKTISKRTITPSNTISNFEEILNFFGENHVNDTSEPSSAS